MGLFDKLKKTENTDTNEEILVGADEFVENAEAEEKEASDNEQFTMTIEQTFQLSDDQGIMVVGFLHGKAAVEDAIEIMYPNGKKATSVIKGIEVDSGKSAETAENQPVAIKLFDIKNKEQVQKYTALAGIRPKDAGNINQAIENVHLLALSRDFKRFHPDPRFMTLFVYVLCHSNFITPVHAGKEATTQEDGSAVFAKGTQMEFMSLTTPADETKRLLPIFTDWNELRKWKKLFKNDNAPKIMLVRFPDIVSIVKKDLSGAVLNAFGMFPVMLSKEHIGKITSLEGYKAEFGSDADSDVDSKTSKPPVQIMVGVPLVTDEVKRIRGAIVEEAIPQAHINQIYLLLKIDQMQKQSYLLVVDCDREVEKQCFRDIAAVVRPHLNEVEHLNIVSYEKFGNQIRGMEKKAIIFDRATFWK